jgi:uncharacterized membrane protein YvbJ
MPVCLNCGKEIDKGKNLCEDCTKQGKAEAGQLLDTGPVSHYKPRRSRNWLTMAIIVFILTAILVGAAFLLLNSVPNDPKVQAKAQANICQNHLEDLQSALVDYYKNSHQYPPTGRINSKSPLVIDKYVGGVLHCPSTGHEYLLENKNGKYTIICDSGLAGHAL